MPPTTKNRHATNAIFIRNVLLWGLTVACKTRPVPRISRSHIFELDKLQADERVASRNITVDYVIALRGEFCIRLPFT
jgi:hypothetical protein